MVHWVPHRKKDLSQRDKKHWENIQILSKWALGSYVFCLLSVLPMPDYQKLVAFRQRCVLAWSQGPEV